MPGKKGLLTSACVGGQIATLYSGAKEGKPFPLVLCLAVGPADRGACIRELSQYQAEIEYLFVPCSLIANDGPPQFVIGEGGLGVRMVPVRISTSHSAITVEEHLGAKKRTHLTAFKYLVEEIRAELSKIAGSDGKAPAADAPGVASQRLARDGTHLNAGPDPVGLLLDRIMEECKNRLREHAAVDALAYADNRVSQRLAGEMLDTRLFAVSKLRLWLVDRTELITSVMDYPPRMCHRLLTKFLTQSANKTRSAEAALAVCKARGLVQNRIFEQTNSDGEDPLSAAAAGGAAATDIRFLIAAGAVNLFSGLLEAARYGHMESAEELLKAKATINVPDQEGVVNVSDQERVYTCMIVTLLISTATWQHQNINVACSIFV